jgi:hypothetical protein
MSGEKRQIEKVRLEGWTAGATEKDKNTNPYRGKKNADEANWMKPGKMAASVEVCTAPRPAGCTSYLRLGIAPNLRL